METKLTPSEQEDLKQSQHLLDLARNKGWQEVLRPWLQSKVQTSWLDPRKAGSDEELLYQYKVAWGFAQAADEILKFVESAKDKVDFYLKKERGEVTNKFSIGK